MNLTQVPISMIDTVAGDAGKVLTSDGSTLSWSSNRIAKAWVNFNGSTSVIRSSYNVSSVTKIGTGAYTVNFTTAMSDANYSLVGGVLSVSISFGGVIDIVTLATSTASIRTIYSVGNGSAVYDSTIVTIAVFGN